MPTVTIPTTTLQIGARDFGPATISDADTSITLTIDRTVTNGLNDTPATHLSIEAMVSLDGGATWTLAAGAGIEGGQLPQPPPPRGPGGFYTANVLRVGLDQYPGTGRRIKATLTVSGSSVAVAGTLTTA
jgi:hypothetical protein